MKKIWSGPRKLRTHPKKFNCRKNLDVWGMKMINRKSPSRLRINHVQKNWAKTLSIRLGGNVAMDTGKPRTRERPRGPSGCGATPPRMFLTDERTPPTPMGPGRRARPRGGTPWLLRRGGGGGDPEKCDLRISRSDCVNASFVFMAHGIAEARVCECEISPNDNAELREKTETEKFAIRFLMGISIGVPL